MWGTGGDGGSDVACSTDLAKTLNDAETQKIGVYYNFQASSSGSGGTLETENIPVPDTFCPLGWQLPYGSTGGDYYDKSRSWNYLFNIYSINDNVTGANSLKSYPFDYIYGGQYVWSGGMLYYLTIGGYYWSGTILDRPGSYRLNTWSGAVKVPVRNNKSEGVTLRCDCGVSILEKLPMASA